MTGQTEQTVTPDNPGVTASDELFLILVGSSAPHSVASAVTVYDFDIVLREIEEVVGTIVLRPESSFEIENYIGHIGYFVNPDCRGHRFAEKACRVLLPIASGLGLCSLIITCNPDNWASRRTCERLGAELLNVVDVPPHLDLYRRGETRKCRYRLSL